MKLLIPLLTMSAVFISLTATLSSAQAECSRHDFRIGLIAPYYQGDNINVMGNDWEFKTPPLKSAGIGLDVEAAFVWGNFGIALEQQLTSTFATRTSVGGDKNSSYIGYFDKGDAAFVGATYFLIKEYVHLGKSTIAFSEGIGAIYGAKIDSRYVFPGDNDAAFAFKFAVQYTYDFTEQYGICVGFEYAGAVKSTDYWHYSHHIVPSISFIMHK